MIAREQVSAGRDGPGPNPGDAEHRIDPGGGDDGPVPSPLEPLLRHLAELQMLVGHYVRARADQITARLRMIAFWLVVGIVGMAIAVAFLVTAVVLVLRGIAGGLILLGLPAWAADLITGVVCIAAVAVFLAIGFFTQNSVFRRKRRDDYEHFKARYRAKFGRSLDEASRSDN